MPQSVYQTTLIGEIIQADFDPKSNDLILLSKNGDLVCRTFSGENRWSIRLEGESLGLPLIQTVTKLPYWLKKN